MNTAEQILVIVLSSFLALFLFLGIALFVGLLKFTKKMNAIADSAQEIVAKAQDIADKVEDVSDMFKKTAGPVALGRHLMNIVEMVTNHKKRSK
jgi:cell division protein FtsB